MLATQVLCRWATASEDQTNKISNLSLDEIRCRSLELHTSVLRSVESMAGTIPQSPWQCSHSVSMPESRSATEGPHIPSRKPRESVIQEKERTRKATGRNNSLRKQSAPLTSWEQSSTVVQKTPAHRNFPQAFPSVLVTAANRNGPRSILLLWFRFFFCFSFLLPHYFNFLRYKLFSFIIYLFY